MKTIVLCGNNKPHITSQLRKAITKRSQLKNKADKTGKLADKTAYKTQRNLVAKLKKRRKKIFPKKTNNRKYYKQNEKFLEIMQTFFH